MSDSVSGLQVPLAGWTVPLPVFKRLEQLSSPVDYPTTLAKVKSHLRVTHSGDDDYLTDLISTATEVVEQYISRKLCPRRVRMWMDLAPGTGRDSALAGSGVVQSPISAAGGGGFRWFDLFGTPVASVESMNFVMSNGASAIIDPSQYIADTSDPDMPARIILQRGAVWPTDLQVAHALSVSYTLGYAMGFAAWAPLTAYGFGATVANGGMSYTCTTSGTSAASGGPSGQGRGISDGTAAWAYKRSAEAVPAPLRHAVLLVAGAFFSNRGDAADAGRDVLQLPAIQATLEPYRVRRMSTL